MNDDSLDVGLALLLLLLRFGVLQLLGLGVVVVVLVLRRLPLVARVLKPFNSIVISYSKC